MKLFAIKKEYNEEIKNILTGNITIKEKPKAQNTIKIKNKIAVIDITGAITRSFSFFSYSDVDNIKEQIQKAIDNKEVDTILLNINSPGGTIDGVPELAEFIYNNRNKKPIISYITNEGCSAAYWLASATSKIYAHKTAIIGSIGVIVSFYFYKNSDVEEVNIVSSQSPKKLIDLSTEEGKSEIQKEVDTLASHFINDVARYRGITPEEVINKYGQGGVFIGEEALKQGLIDELSNFDTIIEEKILKDISKKNKKNIDKKNKTNTKKKRGKKMNKKAMMFTIDGEEIEIPDEQIAEQITRDWLDEYKPDLVQEILDEGAQDENERQAEITDAEETADNIEAIKSVILQARKDRNFEASRIYKEILKAEKNYRAEILKNKIEDSKDIPAVSLEEDMAGMDETKKTAELLKAKIKKVKGIR